MGRAQVLTGSVREVARALGARAATRRTSREVLLCAPPHCLATALEVQIQRGWSLGICGQLIDQLIGLGVGAYHKTDISWGGGIPPYK